MNRRWPIVLVLIASLLGAGAARQWAASARADNADDAARSSASQLSQMNSYALALLLGGLRGPLVMFLWPSAETQKQEKNLEDFDTKIEWIRLLQAEFDTVHIFQIWNKAYNVSAQMANLGNKYLAILDALDYAHRVDRERPSDINILAAIAQIYFDKLGNSSEKAYYSERIRVESRARTQRVRITLPAARRGELISAASAAGIPPRRLNFSEQAGNDQTPILSVTLDQSAADLLQNKFTGPGVSYTPRAQPPQHLQNDASWRRTELDPILDASGNILPQYLQSRAISRGASSQPAEGNDGSELQYLRAFQPFPYGVSPFALAYNYYKRSQILQSVNGQSHSQLSHLVIDSRPALALKAWSESDWELGLSRELEAFNLIGATARPEMARASAELSIDAAIQYPASLNEAIYEYDRSTQLVDAALREYERHLAAYQTNISLYLSHMDGLRAQHALLRADRDYLIAARDRASRDTIGQQARQEYRDAMTRNELFAMQYFVQDYLLSNALPGMNKMTLAKSNFTPQQVDGLFEKVVAAARQDAMGGQNDDLEEYVSYVARCAARIANLPQ